MPSRFKDGDHSSVLPHRRKVMGEENRIENICEERYRSLEKMLQDPVRNTVRARGLAELEILMAV